MTLRNGEPCRKCGTSDWYRSGGCKFCDKTRRNSPQRMAWNEANKEKLAEKKKRYYEANKDARSAYGRAWRGKNKDRIAAQRKEHYEANKNKILGRNRTYRKGNKEKLSAQKKEYYEANKDKVKEYQVANKDKIAAQRRMYKSTPVGKEKNRACSSRRRTRETGAGGAYSVGEFLELCRHYDCHCLRCGKHFPIAKLTADHVIAVVNGGTSDIENLQPLCRSCNSSKGAKNTDYRDKVEWDKYGKPVFWWQDGLKI